MSTTVTMRPRRFSTPAISREDSGTRVTRSGMNTSWTREIGRPNSWPPIIALSAMVSPAAIERGRQAGFHDYVAKFDRPGLIAALKEQTAEIKHAA